MSELESLKKNLMSMMQKTVDVQRSSWHSFFNYTGALGDDFSLSLMNYIRMAFVSFSLANGRTVDEFCCFSESHKHAEIRYYYTSCIEKLIQLGGKVIYRNKDINYCIISFDSSVVNLTCRYEDLQCFVLNCDESFNDKILKIIKE